MNGVTIFDQAVEIAAKQAGLKLGPRDTSIHGYARMAFANGSLHPGTQITAAEAELARLMQFLGGNKLVEDLAVDRVAQAAQRLSVAGE